ncbi:MAG TPA: RiPP maturation radical SAM C-methyltransferase [Patescibacteria group bacterium]|nr:RiPP maturation radical SAM C-methyltransferase [Patescibacteria group bacterium]
MAARETVDVCLVNMPFAALPHPSLALGLLKSSLTQAGIRTAVEYGNLAFAERVGVYNYQAITHSYRQSFSGEFTFAGTAFGGYALPEEEEYYAYRRRNRPAGVDPVFLDKLLDIVREARAAAAAFTEKMAVRILARQPKIVGCISLFEQNCASLALLRRIKALDPAVVTVMGGENCEGQAGLALVEKIPWLDFVISGEADHCLALFCRMILDQGRRLDPGDLPYGVLKAGMCFVNGRVPRLVIEDMDSVPIPDYDDYFHALENNFLQKHLIPGLLVETSRGCWWGEKQPCTFCGLNGQGYRYRPKSRERVTTEFAVLARHYHRRSFEATDNILGMEHLHTVIEDFSALPSKYNIFYEIKSNCTREQLGKLVAAGVRFIQPGIESLHDGPLVLMNKGNKAIRHVELLRNALELGMHCSWNLLWGFPGEKPEWYGEMAAWIDQMIHLQPPNDMIRVAFDRGSVYADQAELYGLLLHPAEGYRYIYPALPGLIDRVAHYYENAVRVQTGHDGKLLPVYRQLEERITAWKERFWHQSKAVLNMKPLGEETWEITDTRPGAVKTVHILQGIISDVYRVCQTVTPRHRLTWQVRQAVGRQWDEAELEYAVEELKKQRLLLEIDGDLLALAVLAQRPELPDLREFPGGFVSLQRLDKKENQTEAETGKKGE